MGEQKQGKLIRAFSVRQVESSLCYFQVYTLAFLRIYGNCQRVNRFVRISVQKAVLRSLEIASESRHGDTRLVYNANG